MGVGRGEGDSTAVGSSTAPLRYVAGLTKLGMMTFRRMGMCHLVVSFRYIRPRSNVVDLSQRGCPQALHCCT
ncbi:unnamed protein product [Ectocarpus sp. 6 AP-2014]